jgi:hypothetical protein
MVEPIVLNCAFNLFANDDVRAALADEPEERRPQMPLVINPASLACRAERLTWA